MKTQTTTATKKRTGVKKRKLTDVMEKKIYTSIIKECQRLQNSGMFQGNGDHLASKLSSKIAEGLLPPQQKKIFSVLTEAGMPVFEIAKKCKLDSKQVSAQLTSMWKRTLLVSFQQEGGRKLWHRMWASERALIK